MTHRPAIDTLEATRALEKAGLDPGVSEQIVRIIDTAVQDGAVSRVELEKVRTDMAKGELVPIKVLGVLVAIAFVLYQVGPDFADYMLRRLAP